MSGKPDNLPASHWGSMNTAPQTSEWISVLLKDGTEAMAHFACDLSGEDQPAFKGWFVDRGTYFSEVDPVGWKPLAQGVGPTPPQAKTEERP